MNIIKAGFEYNGEIDGVKLLKACELAGRLCYASEDKITDDSYKQFIKNIIKRGHTSVLEHASIGVILTVDRGVTHELVRHRTGVAYSQQSTRFCLFHADKFNGELTVVQPIFWMKKDESVCASLLEKWKEAVQFAEDAYMDMVEGGATAQEARSVLPNSLAAKIAVTANLREWRHIFSVRCDKASHPQMREIMLLLLDDFNCRVPIVFDDLYEKFKEDINFVHEIRKD